MKRMVALVLSVILLLSLVPTVSFAEENIVLQVWSYQITHEEKTREMMDQYTQEHPNVQFELTLMPDTDYWTKLAAAASSGTTPDIFYFHNQRISTFKDAMAPYPEDLFPLDEMREKYYAFDAACMIDGSFYFFPMGIMDGQIYYNKQIFADLGVEEPEGTLTWDEFRDLAKRLTVRDELGDITIAGFASKGFGRFMWPDLFFQCDGQWYSEDGTEVMWNSEAGLKATQFFYDLFNTDKVESYDGLSYDQAFMTGTAAMCHSRGFFGGTLAANAPDLDFGVMPIPVVSEDCEFLGRNNYECGYSVSNASSDTEKRAAFEFLKWLYSDEYILFESVKLHRIPSAISLWDDPAILNDLVLSISVKQAPKTIFIGDVPQATLMALENMLTKLYMGQDAESALTEAVQEANEGLKLTPAAWIVESAWKEAISE